MHLDLLRKSSPAGGWEERKVSEGEKYFAKRLVWFGLSRVYHPTRHNRGHFGGGLHSQSLDWYWQTKQYRKILANSVQIRKSKQPKIQQNKTNRLDGLPWTERFRINVVLSVCDFRFHRSVTLFCCVSFRLAWVVYQSMSWNDRFWCHVRAVHFSVWWHRYLAHHSNVHG